MPKLTTDMRAVIESARLCFVATVTPAGHPNLSPKGTLRAWDDDHLLFLDIASPQTRANLELNPHIEINVVDQLSRRGYRFSGWAIPYLPNDDIYKEAMRRVFPDGDIRYSVASVVLVTIERAEPLWSPAYARVENEADMRATWHERRRALDDVFDEYARITPWRPPD